MPTLTRLSIILVSIIWLSGPAFAATFTCGANGVNNSCDPGTLTSLVGSASHGDTIKIATGTHTWNSSVTVNKRIAIMGTGSCPDCGDVNALDTAFWSTQLNISGNLAFVINGSAGSNPDFVRISGIFFNGNGRSFNYSPYQNTGVISMSDGNRMRYRIDNNRFYQSGNGEQNVIRNNNLYGYGVVDHNYDSTSSGYGGNSRFFHNTDHDGDEGDTGWTVPVRWGSENFHFVEDNTFIYPPYPCGIPHGLTDQVGGGRLVGRYNYVENGYWINHGTDTAWPIRGGVAMEIYENTMVNDTSGCSQGLMFTAFNFHSGSARFYSNDLTNFQSAVKVIVMRSRDPRSSCGTCGQPACVDIDGPGPPLGYPCVDQVGTGVAAGLGLQNTQPQGRNPAYVWNITRTNVSRFVDGNYGGSYATEGVDIFTSQDSSARPAGYVAAIYPHSFVSGAPVLPADFIAPAPPFLNSVNPQ